MGGAAAAQAAFTGSYRTLTEGWGQDTGGAHQKKREHVRDARGVPAVEISALKFGKRSHGRRYLMSAMGMNEAVAASVLSECP